MKKTSVAVLLLLCSITAAICQETGPQSEGAEAKPTERQRKDAASDKPPAYLIIVGKTQEGSPELRGHGRGRALPAPEVMKQLEELGFKAREVVAFSPGLTMDYLKQFNVVILGAGGEGNQHALFSGLADEKAKLLLDYVRQGGGLLVLRSPGWQFGKDIDEFNRWLQPTGAEILQEQLMDKENAVELPSQQVLFWTDNILHHPVTKGVEGIFYPDCYGGYMRYTDFSSPVKTSGDWNVLISGKKTADTIRRKKSAVLQPASAGTYKTAPPLLAVRDFGKGRIAVFPVASSCLWQDGYHALWGNGLTMEGKTREMKGCGAKLLANLFAYLSEPSRGTFGGYRPKPSAKTTRDPSVTVIDWDNIRMQGVQRKNCYVGLIGARSALSCGDGQPAAFIQAAKDAGYDFIAFAELLDELTPEEFASLKRLCLDQSDEAFKAYPGFTYLDESGNTWVTFSDKLFWPKEEWFSTKHPGRLSENNTLMRACGKPPVILTQSHLNPEASWFQGNFNAFALFTYENGKLIDNSADHYLRLIRESFRAAPVTVHFVDSPENLKRARQTGFQTYVRWFDDNVVEALTGFSPKHKGRPVWLRSSFVSEGPMIEDTRIANAGTTDLAKRIGADRCRMYVMVSSHDGLKEVAILDADRKRPWRRFLLHGSKAFEQTIDFFHDMQHDLVVTVTDQKDRKAIGWDNPTRVQENAFHRCSDNYNTMPRGKWWGEPQGLMNIRGFENYLVVRNFMYCGTPRFSGLEETKRPAIEYYPSLACRFGSIVDTFVGYHYPPEATANPDRTDVPFCAEKNKYLFGKVTYTCYTGRQDSSLIEHVQGDLEVLSDFASKEGLIFHTMGRLGAHCVCATLEGGLFFSGVFSRKQRNFGGVLPERGFAVLFPNLFNGSLGVIPLQKDLRYTSHTEEDMRHGCLYLKLPKTKKEFRRGEKIRYQYLGMIGPLGSSPDNTFMLDIIQSLGINGKTAYDIKPISGSVEGTSFVLKLKSEKHGFAARVGEAKLPLNLPVQISGLNPRWDAGILYKGETTLVIPEWVINELDERYVVYRERKVKNELLHIPVLDDGTGFLQIDTEGGDKNIYIGNLLVSDDRDIMLTLLDTRPGKAAFVVHNPKDEAVTCRIEPGPGLDLLGEFSKEVTVPAGTSVTVKIQD